MLIDTHAHLNFNAFREDSAEIMKRTLENDIWFIMPGSQYSTSKRAVEIAEKCGKGVYAAVGLHPIHLGEQRKVDVLEVQSSLDSARDKEPWEEFTTRAEEFVYEKYKKLTLSEAASGRPSRRVVAIGEVGLDYYYFPKSKVRREEIKRKQKETLQKQMDLADEFNLPVILHCRKAHDDLIELITTNYKLQTTRLRGVVHSYTGTVEQAQTFMKLGLYVGFNGLILKDVPALPKPEEVIASIPLDHIVLETDSPYLVPPQAGKERNEPMFVKFIAEEIARIKNVSFKEIAEVTTQNARNLFGI